MRLRFLSFSFTITLGILVHGVGRIPILLYGICGIFSTGPFYGGNTIAPSLTEA